mmetsp:Transcript_13553/g.20005  ORF Transcript_13553/g.20005 Transcript_13553/m.20005 type:complete len:585 (+) Transcript_13553:49-1803(+)|eukprot:CAMPEP_0194200978 /NCGR_PEP_ID=MMETSP0156-20130528/1380_1 /TAXON_ID=33649 /ORGANISM="Thalassionema nitzschioides, Strain L26-B" /LENGTH=584 /DNA_ID=CAMNT_0038926061 /DNA_START=10 /DNA_END=1764 /DNA_ORIENTATION=-
MSFDEVHQEEVLKVPGKLAGSKDFESQNLDHIKNEDRGDVNSMHERRILSSATRRMSSRSTLSKGVSNASASELEEELKRAKERESKDRKIVIKTLSTVVDMCSGKDQIILREILSGIGGPTAIVQTARAVEAATLRASQRGSKGEEKADSANRPLSIAVVLSIVVDMCSEDDQLVLRVILDRLGGPVGIVRTMKAIEAYSTRSRKVSTLRCGEQEREDPKLRETKKGGYDLPIKKYEANSTRKGHKSSRKSSKQRKTRQETGVRTAVCNDDSGDDLSLVSLVREEFNMQAKDADKDDLSLVSLVRQEISYDGKDENYHMDNRHREVEATQADDDLSMISLLRQELSFEEQHMGRKSKTRNAQNNETDDLSFVSLIREEMGIVKQRDNTPVAPELHNGVSNTNITPKVIDTDEGSLVSLLRENPSYDHVQAHLNSTAGEEKTDSRKVEAPKGDETDDASDDLSLVSLVRDELALTLNADDASDDLSLVSLVRDELGFTPEKSSNAKKSNKNMKKEKPSDVLNGAKDEAHLSIGALISEALLGDKVQKMYGTSTKLHSDSKKKSQNIFDDVDLSFGALLRDELAP